MEVPLVLLLAPAAGLVLAWVIHRSERRLKTVVVCPADGRPHEVELSGSTFDFDMWTEVDACGLPGQAPLRGPALRCARRCLHTNTLPPVR